MQNSTCAYEIDTKMTKKSIKINILLMTRRADNRKMKINFEVRNWVLISIQQKPNKPLLYYGSISPIIRYGN